MVKDEKKKQHRPEHVQNPLRPMVAEQMDAEPFAQARQSAGSGEQPQTRQKDASRPRRIDGRIPPDDHVPKRRLADFARPQRLLQLPVEKLLQFLDGRAGLPGQLFPERCRKIGHDHPAGIENQLRFSHRSVPLPMLPFSALDFVMAPLYSVCFRGSKTPMSGRFDPWNRKITRDRQILQKPRFRPGQPVRHKPAALQFGVQPVERGPFIRAEPDVRRRVQQHAEQKRQHPRPLPLAAVSMVLHPTKRQHPAQAPHLTKVFSTRSDFRK